MAIRIAASGEAQTASDVVSTPAFSMRKNDFAYAWLRAQAKKRSRREKQILRYVQFTLAAAMAALIVGVVGLLPR